jgi:DNA-binding NarL/FixJ family response regulator
VKIHVILVDDHDIIREGLISLLQQQPDLEVVGQAEDGQSAIELVRKLKPDIVITDVIMPKLNGIDTTRQIVRQFPKVKVIALTGQNQDFFVTGMLKAGASAYVLKECLLDELIEAIRTVQDGRSYISPKLTGIVVNSYIRLLSESQKSPLDSLTQTELKVLQLVGEGKSTKTIAAELCVSPKNIEADRRRIMEKLHTRDTEELVKFSIAGEIIPLEP